MEMSHAGPWDYPDPSSIDLEIIASVVAALDPQTVNFVVAGENRHRFARLVEEAGHRAVCLETSNVDIQSDSEFRAEPGQVNVFVLIDGMRRVHETHSRVKLVELLKWLGTNFQLLILEAPRQGIMPGKVDLGPYSAQVVLDSLTFVSEFVSPTTRVNSTSPRLFASQHMLIDALELTQGSGISHFHQIEAHGQSSTLLSETHVLKLDACSESYFERSEVASEARVLSNLSGHMRSRLRMPAPIHVNLGRAVNTFVRTRVPGAVRMDLVEDETEISLAVELARGYSAVGLFHNDIRPWNFVWDGEVPALIDYADLSVTESDTQGLPQILSLGCTLACLRFPILRDRQDFLELAWELWRGSSGSNVHGVGAISGEAWLALARVHPGAIDYVSPTAIVSSLMEAVTLETATRASR
jgi:hypothetical protein